MRVDLPWSTCPAVATTCTAVRSGDRPEGVGDERVVVGVDRAKVDHGVVVFNASDDRMVESPKHLSMVAVESDTD